jgi:DNA-binding protein HU-beta
MNKSELIKAVAEESQMTLVDAGKALDAALKAIKESLVSGDTVQLIGFGSFKVTERAERKGINPQTKKEITIAGCKLPKFVPGKEFKEAVKNS